MSFSLPQLHKDLLNFFYDCLQKELFIDMKIICADGSVNAHRLMFLAASQFLSECFFQFDMDIITLCLPDYSVMDVENFLLTIYGKRNKMEDCAELINDLKFTALMKLGGKLDHEKDNSVANDQINSENNINDELNANKTLNYSLLDQFLSKTSESNISEQSQHDIENNCIFITDLGPNQIPGTLLSVNSILDVDDGHDDSPSLVNILPEKLDNNLLDSFYSIHDISDFENLISTVTKNLDSMVDEESVITNSMEDVQEMPEKKSIEKVISERMIVGDESIQCDFCPKLFKNRRLLELHKYRIHHNGHFHYACPEPKCSYKSIVKFDMTRHSLVHNNTDRHLCTVCGKCYKRADSLRAHKFSHGVNPNRFYCDICGKGFVKSDQYKNHLRIHSDERPFVCNFCGESFKLKSTLCHHIKIHSKEEKYKCETCQISFRTSKLKYKHTVLKHSKKNNC